MFKNFRTLGAAFDAGKTWISTFRKVPAATATITGQWFDYGYAAGNPIPNYYAASPLVAATLEPDARGRGRDWAALCLRAWRRQEEL